MVEKFIKDGHAAVIISYGYGLGWSTEAYDDHDRQTMLFHPLFVEVIEKGVKDVGPIAEEIFGDDTPCLGGWNGCVIEWVPVETQFIIDEYDGAESLTFLSDLNTITA